jgi:hypothetical protein
VRSFLVAFLAVLLVAGACAQSPTGTISGIVFDPDAKAVPGADIIIVNDLTHLQYESKTSEIGLYTVPNLPPGPYRVQVSKAGFKTLIKPDIVLNVQDSITINFTLPVGAASIAVTVEGGAPIINTQDASVGTVIDNTYIRNMPLNGRSFQDLILLTPGVVTTSPQAQASLGYNGEFSVNGQRTESNSYTVDGVSANVSTTPGAVSAPSSSGSLPSATVLGTTQALVSVDSLQEFRVQTSSYSAEYGRTPGGQFVFVTRSGTNDWHGTLFEYFRNNVFDANDWFNNAYGLPQPALRQNDFGGTVGGPVEIPRRYNGRDRTFFFFSYEGLRLVQPQEASISYVPNNDLRQHAQQGLQPVLEAFPAPNGTDFGNGLAEFKGTWSNPSQIDAYSVRLDHEITDKWHAFFRFSATPSSSNSRQGGNFSDPAVVSGTHFTVHTYTAALDGALSPKFHNELRFNYSSNDGVISQTIDNFGGGHKVSLLALQGLDNGTNPVPAVGVLVSAPGYYGLLAESRNTDLQQQWNVTDAASISLGRHSLKIGVDYRRLTPTVREDSPSILYQFRSANSAKANSVDSGNTFVFSPAYPVYQNFSAFVQDEWRVSPRLTLSLGLRWDVNPAPGAGNGELPFTVRGSSLGSLSLAPRGTALWNTSWYNFAPRLGAAYVVRNHPGQETVVRGGFGVFYDTGQQAGSYGYLGPGFEAQTFFGSSVGTPASFPAPLSAIVPSVTYPPVPPYGAAYAYPSHLQLPYTLQWNGAVQQSLGKDQALTVSYVAAAGRRLLAQNLVQVNNGTFNSVTFFETGLTSDYDALQVQFQRRLSRGISALGSYTFSHCLDYGSQSTSYPSKRGNCDADVRHNFSGAVSADLPATSGAKWVRFLANGWGLDGRLSARTGFPVPLNGPSLINPATGQFENAGLDLVQGQPIYLYGSSFPGGRAVNPNAFGLPQGCTPFSCDPTSRPGNAPRNFVRGFGAFQTDLALRREFALHERLKLQFRAEAFNIFNHPNFGMINTFWGNNLFGQATGSLAQSLGVLSPLYQTGGPRSLQFALRLTY